MLTVNSVNTLGLPLSLSPLFIHTYCIYAYIYIYGIGYIILLNVTTSLIDKCEVEKLTLVVYSLRLCMQNVFSLSFVF